jgi:hypothetical protein
MSKYFDIIPPQPKEKPKTKAKKFKNQFVWFLLIILLLILFISLPKQTNTNLQNTASPDTTKATEELTEKPKINPEQTTNPVQPAVQNRVRIINASSKPENMTLAIKLLAEQGFEIEQSNNVENRFGQTNIYFRKGQEEMAEKAKSALSNDFQIATDLSVALSDSYDLLIVVGDN